MIREHYKLERLTPYNAYKFESIGPRGVVQKFIIFEEMGNGVFNLAFGDIIDGKAVDNMITNNHDVEKTISTVVKAIHLFFKENPQAILEVEAIDERRLRLYNRIFSKRHLEIQVDFVFFGYLGEVKEAYVPDSSYTKFEICLKMV